MTDFDIRVESLGESRVLRFAMDEWRSLYETAAIPLDVRRLVLGTWEQLRQAEPRRAADIAGTLAKAEFKEEFVISRQGDDVYLIGGNERAALYAVYRYTELALGLHWIHPGEQPARSGPLAGLTLPIHETPLMERRGFVFETIDDVPFIRAMVDWLAKHRVNELFFTFTLWDEIGSELQEMIVDRGLDITLGGHSAAFFLNRLEADKPMGADHPYTAKKQLDYTDESWQSGLIGQIVAYCRSVENLKTVSLWPEDVKHRQTDGFLTHYIAFTERLREQLLQDGQMLDIEHIAYNAGLAWDMLELRGQQPSVYIDTLYAYWGRDYRFSPGRSESASDVRVRDALKDWSDRLRSTGRKLTVFEYYSDHYMLSPLFPMLATRIAEDVEHYAKLGIHGMTNLVVPSRVEGYPYQWNQVFNSFAFARALWGESAEEISNRFAAYFNEELQPHVVMLFEQLEREMAVLTKWNVPFFPSRAVDHPDATARTEADKEQVIRQVDRIMALAERYLAMDEIKRSQPLEQTLAHYASYAGQVKRQWQDLTPNV